MGFCTEGEEKVAEALRSLEGFHVFNDVVLPGGKANVDHVVLSVKGVDKLRGRLLEA